MKKTKREIMMSGVEWRKSHWAELADAGPEGINGRTVLQDVLEWTERMAWMIEEHLDGALASCKSKEDMNLLWEVFDELSQEALKYLEVK